MMNHTNIIKRHRLQLKVFGCSKNAVPLLMKIPLIWFEISKNCKTNTLTFRLKHCGTAKNCPECTLCRFGSSWPDDQNGISRLSLSHPSLGRFFVSRCKNPRFFEPLLSRALERYTTHKNAQIEPGGMHRSSLRTKLGRVLGLTKNTNFLRRIPILF